MDAPAPDLDDHGLIAGRPKDITFAEALIREDLIDPAVLRERAELLDDAHPIALSRLKRSLDHDRG